VRIVCDLLTAYLVVLFVRALMSWFPIRPGTPAGAVLRVLTDLTEPVIAPVRRVIPPAGVFDISYMVVFIGFLFLHQIICPGGGFI
jgi:YggT family protein